MFNEDQKVLCTTHGEGVVIVVDGSVDSFPVEVEFTNGKWECYTKDGKLYEKDDEPSLSVIGE